MRPGATQLTVTPAGPSSRAATLSQPDEPRADAAREREIVDRLLDRARRDRDHATVAARLEVRAAETDEPDRREQEQLRGALDLLVGGVERLRPRRAAGVEHDDVDAAEALDAVATSRSRSSALVMSPATGDAADALCLTLEDVLAAGEHDDVRARFGERLRAAQADPGRRTADDCRAPAEAELHI